jgi:hypothetical protein
MKKFPVVKIKSEIMQIKNTDKTFNLSFLKKEIYNE